LSILIAMRLLVVLCLLFPLLAHGANLTIACDPPTQWTPVCTTTLLCDPPKPITTPIKYNLYKPTQTAPLVAGSAQCLFPRTNLGPGTYQHYVTATVDGVESDPSTTVTSLITGTPPPPLLTAGPFSYEPTGTAAAPTMSAIGLVDAGLPCGPVTRVVGAVTFCQITHAQTDLIGWPTEKTLKNGLWARAQ
jgi:hypothetical protein